MQVKVHKSMRTTLPRRPAAVNGCELSHSVALPREGNSPSMDTWTAADVIGCTALLPSARVSIGAPIAQWILASRSWSIFMMNPFHTIRSVGTVALLPGWRGSSPQLVLDTHGLADIYVAFSNRLANPAAGIERGFRGRAPGEKAVQRCPVFNFEQGL